ncbi:hypothetical protein [Mesorhizobium muleiense]|uniref:hypothetical protein n=1 Tax=Mesorhizobium muleiense TaxID=1004279 RepID=UPI001F2C7DB9|nr:hypothetical protein [Mesorhizobium muleiense]MCF6115220.1 hypothetical protein [Mesorhizobium muleiense]
MMRYLNLFNRIAECLSATLYNQMLEHGVLIFAFYRSDDYALSREILSRRAGCAGKGEQSNGGCHLFQN